MKNWVGIEGGKVDGMFLVWECKCGNVNVNVNVGM